jgi:hypothetical protein
MRRRSVGVAHRGFEEDGARRVLFPADREQRTQAHHRIVVPRMHDEHLNVGGRGLFAQAEILQQLGPLEP